MESMLVNLEIEFPAEKAQRLEKFFKTECIDCEKWFKKIFLSAVKNELSIWELHQTNKKNDLVI